MPNAGGELYLSTSDEEGSGGPDSFTTMNSGDVYGSDVLERSYWGGGDYSSWIDYSNSLPPGLLQRYYIYVQPTAYTDTVGTAIVRIQIWRQSRWQSSRTAFQLVWQKRILALPCNKSHGALHVVGFC